MNLVWERVSYGFKRNWISILREAERKLMVALKSGSSAMQYRVSREFHAKTSEYTKSYGDQTVKHWLKTLEKLRTRGVGKIIWWPDVKQSSKCCLGKSKIEDVGRCRPETTQNLRTLISNNVVSNDSLENNTAQDFSF
jgi:hypothetical protein